MVHRVNGKFAASYYYDSPEAVREELPRQFDPSKNIYLISIDIGILDPVGLGCFSWACGFASWTDKGAGGDAIVAAPHDVPGAHSPPIAHELGHAFGLVHDFRYANIRYISERANVDPMLVSFCAAEWLDVNRYFNDFPRSPDAQTTIRMLPPLAAPSYAIRLQFEVNDSDRLHQTQLLGLANQEYWAEGAKKSPEIIDCKSLNGGSATVEFVTIGLTGGSTTAATKVWLQVTDVLGNFTMQEFPIDIAPLLPHPEVVSVPDANLASETLGCQRVDLCCRRETRSGTKIRATGSRCLCVSEPGRLLGWEKRSR